MIRISNTVVFGFEPALHGMRNPMESWNLSDSTFYDPHQVDIIQNFYPGRYKVPERPCIGKNDLELMRKLVIGGSEHRKFLRAIGIWAFIEPNRGCWQELDTYKVATVRNSCSTMHKLGHRPLIKDDFQNGIVLDSVLNELNRLGAEYRETKDFALVIQMKCMLPEGFLQGADYYMNYENALSMFHQRFNHRLPEWKWTEKLPFNNLTSICDWIYSLPYMAFLIYSIRKHKTDYEESLREEGRQQLREQMNMETLDESA
jgi:hypothetical protein